LIRRLDENGDIVLKGDTHASGVEEVRIELIATLRMFKGEYWRNVNLGVPWFESVFQKNPDLGYINAILNEVISNVSGVKQVMSLTTSYDNSMVEISATSKKPKRQLVVTVEVLTTAGEQLKIEELNVYN
jgi:hypothetical protein